MTRRDMESRLANTATWPLPNRDQIRQQLATCTTCGGAYLDTDIGADSHDVVMGHRPATKLAPHQQCGEALCADGENAANARDPTTDPGQNEPPADDEPRE